MFEILVKIKWFFKEYKWRYIIAIPCLITASVFSILPPKIIGSTIDAIADGTLTEITLTRLLFTIGLVAVSGYIISFIWIYLLFGSGFLLEYIYRKKFFRHLLEMDTPFFEKNLIGDLMAKATVDLNQLQFTAGRGILMLLDTTTYLTFILLTMLFTISVPLTIVAFIPIPFVVLYTRRLGQTIHEYVLDEQNTFGTLNDTVLESVSGVRVIRAYVQEQHDIERLQAIEEKVYHKALKVFKSQAKFEVAFKLTYGLAFTAAIGLGTSSILKGTMTPGDLVSFVMYLGMLGWPLMAMGQMVNIFQRGNASFDRINNVLTTQTEVTDSDIDHDFSNFHGLEFKNYTFKYPLSEFDTLVDVSFTLKQGKTLGIVGKTGSGKSTIIKQLLREYKIGTGDIFVNEQRIQDVKIKNVRDFYGYVPQEHVLFSKTVEENIRMSYPDATNSELEDAILYADFRKDVEFLTQGLETVTGEDGVLISGGQKQRLQIARALLKDPEILILDDSLSAVDGKTEKTILTHLKEVRGDKTNIIIAHRLSAVEIADEIIVLDQGRIIDRGTHQELISRDGWYKEQYEIQQMSDGGEA